jgi:hypothetical protein
MFMNRRDAQMVQGRGSDLAPLPNRINMPILIQCLSHLCHRATSGPCLLNQGAGFRYLRHLTRRERYICRSIPSAHLYLPYLSLPLLLNVRNVSPEHRRTAPQL